MIPPLHGEKDRPKEGIAEPFYSILTAIISAKATVVAHVDRDGYGNVTVSSGSGFGEYGFVGQRSFSEVFLIKGDSSARWYDPTVGRWIEEDSIRFDSEDQNLYRYVRNNSTNMVDPNGQDGFFVEPRKKTDLNRPLTDNGLARLGIDPSQFAKVIRWWDNLPMDEKKRVWKNLLDIKELDARGVYLLAEARSIGQAPSTPPPIRSPWPASKRFIRVLTATAAEMDAAGMNASFPGGTTYRKMLESRYQRVTTDPQLWAALELNGPASDYDMVNDSFRAPNEKGEMVPVLGWGDRPLAGVIVINKKTGEVERAGLLDIFDTLHYGYTFYPDKAARLRAIENGYQQFGTMAHTALGVAQGAAGFCQQEGMAQPRVEPGRRPQRPAGGNDADAGAVLPPPGGGKKKKPDERIQPEPGNPPPKRTDEAWTNPRWIKYPKHIPPPKKSWADITKGTSNGKPAKYKPDIDIEKLERDVWRNGKDVTNGKTWKVMEFPQEIGASDGKSSRWVRVEWSSGAIHGHPIPESEFKHLTKLRQQ